MLLILKIIYIRGTSNHESIIWSDNKFIIKAQMINAGSVSLYVCNHKKVK